MAPPVISATAPTSTSTAPSGVDIEQTHRLRKVSVTLRAKGSQEYIAADRFMPSFYTSDYVRALPLPTDRIIRDFTTRIIDDMLRDPQLYSVLKVLELSILSDGYKVVPPRRYKDDKAAEPVRQFCEDLLEGIDRSPIEVLRDLVSGALRLGNKAAELVWNPRKYERTTRIMLDSVKPRPQENMRYVADGFNNVYGVIYVGAGQLLIQGPISAQNEEYLKQVIPREEKFLVVSFNTENSDIRGRPHITHAYTPWWEKQQTTPPMLQNLAAFGVPSLVGTLAPDAPREIKLPDGSTVTSTAQMNQALQAVQNGSVMTVPNGAGVTVLETKGDGSAFINSMEHFDKQMAKAILLQTMTTEEAAHMARAASAVHEDVFGIVLSFFRIPVSFAVRADIFTYGVQYNFPREQWKYTPYLTLGGAAPQDMARLWTAAAALGSSGMLTDPQKRDLDPQIGLPQRSLEDVQKAQALKDAATTAARTLNPGGNQTGSGDGGSGGNNNPQKDNSPMFDQPEKVGQNG